MIAVFVPAVTRYASFLNLNLNIYTTILCVETILYFATRRDHNFCFIFFFIKFCSIVSFYLINKSFATFSKLNK